MTINKIFAAAAMSIAVGATGIAGCSTYGTDTRVADQNVALNCTGSETGIAGGVTGGVGGAIGGRNINGVTPAYNTPLCAR